MTSPLYVNNDQIIKSNIFLASISVFVSLFTIILYLSKKTLHTFKLGMMFGIAVSEMINGIGYILSFCLLGVTKDTIETIDNSIVCNMQRFFTIYPDLSTSLFLIFFAYSTYDLIQNNSNKLEKKTKNIIIIGFTVPLIITIFFLFIFIYILKAPSPVEDTEIQLIALKRMCWAERSIVITYILYSLTFGMNFIMLFYLFRVIHFMETEMPNNPKMIAIKNKLYSYPIAGSLCFVLMVLSQIDETAFYKAIFIDRNEVAVRTFFSLRGLILFIIFLNNNKVKKIVRDILEKVFGKIDKIELLEIIKEHEDEYEITDSSEETVENNLSEEYNK